MSKETIVVLHCDTCNSTYHVEECGVCGKDVCGIDVCMNDGHFKSEFCRATTMSGITVCRECYYTKEGVQELDKELQTGVIEIHNKCDAQVETLYKQVEAVYKQRNMDEDALVEAIKGKLKSEVKDE